MAIPNPRFFVFQDYVHNNYPLLRFLTRQYGEQNVRWVDAGDVAEGVLDEQPDALIIPGGASRYGGSKLKDLSNSRIKEYVKRGGRYIGICGGGYYGCARTRWLENHDNEICVDNQLAFFPGDGQGPIAQLTAHEPHFRTAAITSIALDDGRRVSVFYWGGPAFVPTATEGYEVWASYADIPGTPAAVVHGAYGRGYWLLLSPHLEYDTRALRHKQFNVRQNALEELVDLDPSGLTTDLFIDMIGRLLAK